MAKVIVLGAGMVGSVMAEDLLRSDGLEVTVADRSESALAHVRDRTRNRVETIVADVSDTDRLREIVSSADVVLGAMASRLGFQTLRAVIEAGRPYADISFMPEDALQHDALAKKHGVTAVVDCGVAPGLSNMLAGAATAILDECERIDIAVGGVPMEPKPPFYYKAGFAPSDVIEEYTRPARLVEHGKVVVREALSEVEPITLESFEPPRPLESFNTDGLRSLIETLDVPFMRERTIRYAGHADEMRVLRDTGLFDPTPVGVGDTAVSPLAVTSALLFPKWSYEPDEADLTLMVVVAEGRRNGTPTRLRWELVDEFDPSTRSRSMARTTAFPNTIVARMLLSGEISEPGVLPPERIGVRRDLLEHILGELATRGVELRFTEEPI